MLRIRVRSKAHAVRTGFTIGEQKILRIKLRTMSGSTDLELNNKGLFNHEFACNCFVRALDFESGGPEFKSSSMKIDVPNSTPVNTEILNTMASN